MRKLVILLLVFFPLGVGYSDEAKKLYGEEKDAALKQFLSTHSKIENLHVKYELIATGDDFSPIHRLEEWAFSGGNFDKLYFKEGSPSDVDKPYKERYGVSVWDGEYLKAYDSGANTGSLRDSSSINEKTAPTSLYSFYSRQFGYKDIGPFSKLMEITKIEDWELKKVESENELILIYNGDMPRATLAWHFDIQKNYMTKKFEEKAMKKNGEIRTIITMEVFDPKEIKPGIWLPQKIDTKVTYYRDSGPEVANNNMVIMESKVNEPENEEIFDFQFPEGSQYYDYIIDEAVVPFKTEEILEQEIAMMADDIKEMKPISSTEKAELQSKVNPDENVQNGTRETKLAANASEVKNIQDKNKTKIVFLAIVSSVILLALFLFYVILKR